MYARLKLARNKERGWIMLYWALVFFIVAIIAGILGFTGVAVAATEIAKVLFFLFLVVFIVFLILGLVRGRGPPPPL